MHLRAGQQPVADPMRMHLIQLKAIAAEVLVRTKQMKMAIVAQMYEWAMHLRPNIGTWHPTEELVAVETANPAPSILMLSWKATMKYSKDRFAADGEGTPFFLYCSNQR